MLNKPGPESTRSTLTRPKRSRRWRRRPISSSTRGAKSTWPPSEETGTQRSPMRGMKAVPRPVPAATRARFPSRPGGSGTPSWRTATSPSASSGIPSAVATRSLISDTTWISGTPDSRASAAPSTTQARLGVLTRLSTAGPAMPKQAAWMPPGAGGPAARKAATTDPSSGWSGLRYWAERTSWSVPAATSKSPRLHLVPPTSPARIISDGTCHGLPEGGEALGVLVSELDAQDGAPPLLQSLAVAFGLGTDQRTEGVGGLGHRQVLVRLIDDLQEAAAVRAALVELPRGVQEAGAVAEGHGELRLGVEVRLEARERRGGLRPGGQIGAEAKVVARLGAFQPAGDGGVEPLAARRDGAAARLELAGGGLLHGLVGERLGELHVGLVERVQTQHRAGGGGRHLP